MIHKLLINITPWIEMIWFDNRLKWNPNEFDGIKEITLDINKIWINYFYLIISVKLIRMIYQGLPEVYRDGSWGLFAY